MLTWFFDALYCVTKTEATETAIVPCSRYFFFNRTKDVLFFRWFTKMRYMIDFNFRFDTVIMRGVTVFCSTAHYSLEIKPV